MINEARLIKTLNKCFDCYYVVDTQSVEVNCCENTDFQKNFTLNDTDFLSSFNISLKTSSIDSTKNIDSLRDFPNYLLVQVVAMMNKAYKLKTEICFLKNQSEARKKFFNNINIMNFCKSKTYLLRFI